MKSNEILRKARIELVLSPKYIASALSIPRTAVVQIESGNRKISESELKKMCSIYSISSDYVLGLNPRNETKEIFARGFEGLSEEDQAEIINLIDFKKQMALKKSKRKTVGVQS